MEKSNNKLLSDYMSILPTFYEELFCTKVVCKAFLYLKFAFGYLLFWRKKIDGKGDLKMLVKMTTGVNFMNDQHSTTSLL